MKPGEVVYVKRGREKGSFMVVVEACDRYLFLADGRRRKLCNPKKKNVKHVSYTKAVVSLTPDGGRNLQDADIRMFLRTFVLKEVTHIV